MSDAQDPKHLQLQVTRAPIRGVDVSDTEATRAWILRHVEARVGLHAAVPALFRYLREDAEEHASIEGLVELGEEGLLAAFLRSAGQREGILRRFREGELLVHDDEGKLRRAACAMELVERDEEPPGWWCAHRFFGEGEAGVGNFHGPWVEVTGIGFEGLEPPFREWLDPGEATATMGGTTDFQPRGAEDCDLRMALLDRPPTEPSEPAEFAAGIGRSMDGEVLRQGLTCHVVFVLNDTALERFELRGEMPCDPDDVIRNLVRLGDTQAVALVVPGIFTMEDGTNKRAVFTVAEVRGHAQRARRVLVVELIAGQPPKAIGELMQTMELAEGQGWLGVEPGTELGLQPAGVDGLGTGVVPEG